MLKNRSDARKIVYPHRQRMSDDGMYPEHLQGFYFYFYKKTIYCKVDPTSGLTVHTLQAGVSNVTQKCRSTISHRHGLHSLHSIQLVKKREHPKIN